MKNIWQNSGGLVAGAAVVLIAAQPVFAQSAKVTSVKLSQTNNGLNLVLETSSGKRPQVFTSRRGNTFIADIINTQLQLPQGNTFRQENPAPGVALVAVNQLDANSIRILVTGSKGAPNGQISDRNTKGLTLSLSPGEPVAAKTPGALPQVSASPPAAIDSKRPTTTAQTPGGVMVPNPNVTIDGAPVPSSTPTTPPLLPRAIAPPVGDIAVSNTDSSPSQIDLGTQERVPRLVLREAPVREVLALLARAAGLNLAFSTAPASGQQPDQGTAPNAAAGAEGPRISLDIENESVQDVFNYVLRLSGLQANREGRTIFVGTRLPNQARDVLVRSLRLNQVDVGVALNFLVGMGAESAVSRERTITSVNAVPVGGSAAPATQTQTSTETRIELQRVEFQDSLPLLRGLQVLGDERTNSVTLIGTPKQLDLATSQLIQLDSRRRQVAVNVKIVDVNLLATEDFNTSFSFGIGNTFFASDGGTARVNFGGVQPPTSGEIDASRLTPPVTTAPFPEGAELGPFLDAQPNTPFNNSPSGTRPPFGTIANPLAPGVTAITPGTGTTPGTVTYELPSLFQYPSRFLSSLQAQVQSGNAKILTDPTLTVQEGQTAQVNLTSEVFAGTEIQYVSANAGGNSIPVERPVTKDAGLTVLLRVERIDDNGFVSLSVAPTVSAPSGSAQVSTGETITLLSERSLTSGLIRLRDGQTLILSGIIQDADRTTVSKVPILGDIPLLGALFRSTRRENTRQEVIVLLTPQILDDSERGTGSANYTPGADARQLLERSRIRQQAPSSNP